MTWSLGAGLGMGIMEPYRAIKEGVFLRSVTLMKTKKMHKVFHLMVRVLCFFAVYILPFLVLPFIKALFVAYYPTIVVSWFFMTCTQMNHFTPENTDTRDSDYFKH